MKKNFIKYLKNQINTNQKLIQNSINPEDKSIVESAITELTSILNAVENTEDENTEVIDMLKKTTEQLKEGLTAVNEKLNQKKEESEDMNENYLESKNSLKDFANVIRNAKTVEEYKNGWTNCLTTNGITIEEGSELGYLPAPVKGLINDVWDRNSGWLSKLHYTNAKQFYVRHNVSEQETETSRAKGWKKGGTKTAQTLTFAAKLLQGQFIYKIQEIDLKTKFDNDEDLITYVLEELASQILYEVKRTILVGDSRDESNADKITSIESILKDATDEYTIVKTQGADTFLVDELRALVDDLHNPNNKEITAFMSKSTLRELSRTQGAAGATPIYMGKDYVAEQLGVNNIETVEFLGSNVKCIVAILDEYYIVGDSIMNPTLTTDHSIYTNTDVYRMEAVIGGGINGLKSSGVLKAQ